MTEQEAYQEHICCTHNTYCRIVIRYASFDAVCMLAARWKREISLEYLTKEKFVPLSSTDKYFSVPDYGETYPFSVRGILYYWITALLLRHLPDYRNKHRRKFFCITFSSGRRKKSENKAAERGNGGVVP